MTTIVCTSDLHEHRTGIPAERWPGSATVSLSELLDVGRPQVVVDRHLPF